MSVLKDQIKKKNQTNHHTTVSSIVSPLHIQRFFWLAWLGWLATNILKGYCMHSQNKLTKLIFFAKVQLEKILSLDNYVSYHPVSKVFLLALSV